MVLSELDVYKHLQNIYLTSTATAPITDSKARLSAAQCAVAIFVIETSNISNTSTMEARRHVQTHTRKWREGTWKNANLFSSCHGCSNQRRKFRLWMQPWRLKRLHYCQFCYISGSNQWQSAPHWKAQNTNTTKLPNSAPKNWSANTSKKKENHKREKQCSSQIFVYFNKSLYNRDSDQLLSPGNTRSHERSEQFTNFTNSYFQYNQNKRKQLQRNKATKRS